MIPSLALSPYHPPAPDKLETIFVDEDIVIANKPSGLLSVPGRGPEKSVCAVSILSERHGEVFTVHRLDMDTSGIMVFARTKPAQSRLARAFQDRRVQKTYLAIVHGQPHPPTGLIDFPIAALSKQRPLRHIEENGREAITEYEVIENANGKTLLNLTPKTGRSHQLRLHLQAIGTPILGDRFYGRDDGCKHLLLHAQMLEFRHPGSNELVRYTASRPDDFKL